MKQLKSVFIMGVLLTLMVVLVKETQAVEPKAYAQKLLLSQSGDNVWNDVTAKGTSNLDYVWVVIQFWDDTSNMWWGYSLNGNTSCQWVPVVDGKWSIGYNNLHNGVYQINIYDENSPYQVVLASASFAPNVSWFQITGTLPD